MMNVASTTNILPGSGFSPRTPYVQLERCPVGELSLSTEAECLSLHADCSTNVQNVQEEGNPSADALLTCPRHVGRKRFASFLGVQASAV